MSLILKITDTTFTDATLPVLQRDGLVDAGTKFLFDFADPYCFVKQAQPVNGDQFVNFVNGGAAATASLSGSTLGFSGGGITGFDQEQNELIELPAAGNLPTTNQGFVFCLWLKHLTQGDQTNFDAVAGYAYQTGTGCQYAISADNAGGKYRMYTNGNHTDYAFPAAGTIIQLATAMVKVGTNFVARAYVNGAQIGADIVLGAVSSFSLNQPGSGNMANPRIGYLAGYAQAWYGTVYRTWLNDTGSTGVDPLTLVQNDWAQNNARTVYPFA